MHVYATESDDRSKTFGIIGLIALGLAYGVSQIFSPPWWLDTPAVLGYFGLVYKFYDQYLWHLSVRGWRLSDVPDLRGTWVVAGTSSHTPSTQFHAVLHIRQTWSRISILLETVGSTSASTMAILAPSTSPNAGVRYEYLNTPKASSLPTMHMHYGIAYLRLLAGGRTLEGDYYSGRDRQNFGTMRADFVDQTLLSRQEAFQRAGIP